ncbi:MAG TPA: hypothetical protein VLM79_31160, partial [Kofleriaceae bacterium]|nr:hypothetical protein [Kofleriaceae bacterium]
AAAAATRPADAATPLPVPMSTATPLPAPASTATPLPGGSAVLSSQPAELAPLPRAIRAVSLADVSEPIPLTWIVRSGVVIGVAIVIAIILAIATHCQGSDSRPAAKATAGSSEHAAPAAAGGPGSAGSAAPARPATPAATPARPATPAAAPARPATPAAGAKPGDRDAQLKALVRDLESGKTCGDRRAAIGRLVDLGDARAIPALRRAMVRGGPGDEGNACLKSDADRAIKELAPPR